MINRIIHFSDLHIRLFKDHDLYREILTEAFTQWRNLKPDRIVFTGDLVHSKNQMTPELVEMISWVLTECAKIAKTIIIPGNHDFLENNVTRLDALSPVIDALNNPNIIYYKTRGEYEDENIDWVVYSLYEHNIPPVIEPTGRTKIGLFHGPIIGLKTDVGYEFDSGFDKKGFEGCDIVLCGDIHKRQIFDIPNGGKAYMIGSTLIQNFGEKISNHGYGVYNVAKDEYTTHELFNKRPFLKFKITSIEDIENGAEILTNE
jgi:DNA repair exonuclease SbcCD nuclease subunit